MSNPFFDDARNQPSPFRRPASRPAPAPRTASADSASRSGRPSNMGPFRDGFGNTRQENIRRFQAAGFRGPAQAQAGPNPVIQQVSRMGVDPRSVQGREIMDLLSSGYDSNDPMVSQMIGDLVAEYQDTLIGPLARKTSPAPGDAMGPFFDREGNQFGYTTGDSFAELDKLSTENLARIQGRMVGLGLLDTYVPGRKDTDTQKAFGWLLQMSNASGRDWASELRDLERIQAEDPEGWEDRMGGGAGGREGPAPFVQDAYLAPDYATLAQTVKNQLRDSLGRDPDDAEMALLTAELSGWDREAFQAEQDAMRAEYEAQVQAGEDGTEGLSGGESQTIDPVARFRESFESRFSGELRGLQRREETEQSQALTQGAVSTLSQMAGGMG